MLESSLNDFMPKFPRVAWFAFFGWWGDLYCN
jgi:hypothetical protein